MSLGNNKEIIKTFIGQALASQVIPFAEWQTVLFPLVVKLNTLQTPIIPNDELALIWDSIVSEEKENQTEKNDTQEEEEILKVFLKNKTEGTYLLAKYIVKKYNIITVGEKEREMFVYRNGAYMPAENEVIYPEIQRILKHHVNKNAKTETHHKIADETSYSRSVFSSTEYKYIPLKNGVFNLETKELTSHDPKYRFLYQFPIVYDSKADCIKTKSFLSQVLTPDQIEIIQEWMGYYFYRYYMFKKALILVGDGDTGKTTLLEVITHLLGRDNISSVSLHKMSSDKFSAAHLYNKHGNLVDELSAQDIGDTGAFKVATGGGSITGEYKFGNQFSFLNFSKYTFACNKVPDVTDFNDTAYFNRWMIVRFEKPIQKKIPNFFLSLATEEERSGLFNFAMQGLERLLQQQEFSYRKNATETKQEMMRSGSSIAMFSAEMLEQKDGGEISKDEMYEHYVEYCRKNNLATETIKMLGTKLPFYVVFLTDGYISGINGKGKPDQVRGWRNAKIKGEKPIIKTGDAEFDKSNQDALKQW
ncbi:MAG: phage/plasmid primase, P4 family [Patescibacteria group bacterium]